MKRNKLLLQALVVTLMGAAAHLTRPAPAASETAHADPCIPMWHCGNICSWGPAACDGECNYICLYQGGGCGQMFEACYSPE
jgi:hypothetical protein